jgi:type II secretory pathway pseudopilin PulG
MTSLPLKGARSKKKKGFSLIEAAVVLGVVGVVIGGIWVATSAVLAKMRVNTLTQEVMTLYQNVIAAYPRRANDDFWTPDPITNTLVPATWTEYPAWSSFVEPSFGYAMNFGGDVDGGNFELYIWPISTSTIPKSICINLVTSLFMALKKTGHDVGLNSGGTMFDYPVGSYSGIDYSLSAASSACAAGSVQIHFYLDVW